MYQNPEIIRGVHTDSATPCGFHHSIASKNKEKKILQSINFKNRGIID